MTATARSPTATSPLKPMSLPGLDAQNPLGFLAALGLLRVLDDHARRAPLPWPRLAFIDDGQQTAQIWSTLDYAHIKEVILADAHAQEDSAALRLAYDDEGNLVDPASERATRDLKPPPKVARRFLAMMADAPRRDADLASAFFSELVEDNNGNIKPTALHFTAGQQAFLRMVEELRAGLTAEDVDEALLGPWTNTSKLPSLSWDSSASRAYALRASDPSKDKRGTVAAANWLGVHGLAFLPVSARRRRLVTAGVEGGWKDSTYSWPVWSTPVDVKSVKSLLLCAPARWTARERTSAGVTMVLRAGIVRSDQGGYGSFTPSTVVLPGGG